MNDKPLVVALADENELGHFYENVAESAGISCKAFRHSEEVPADFRNARMAILNQRALCNVGLFSGSRVLITGGDVYGDYRDYCVNEVWQNPVSVGVLQGLMCKYTSDKPRVLCVEDSRSYLDLVLFHVRKAGFVPVPAETYEEALKQVTSVHAVISDLHLLGSADGRGYDLLAKVRAIYDGYQLPFALISNREIDGSKACQAQIVMEKPMKTVQLIDLINSIVPQHLKP